MISTGLHGFGRFAQHFLYAWLSDPDGISLDFACDEQLTAEAVCDLLIQHDRLDFSSAMPQARDGELLLTRADGLRQRIIFHHGPAHSASWLGLPDVWLECSGLYTQGSDSRHFRVGRTRQVLVSATCWDADQTLIMGFNHESWQADASLLSYGSCTVNAFVPLAACLHDNFEIYEADVSIIHNLPAHRLVDFPHPQRRECTLTQMAPRLLPWLNSTQFFVNYTVIPYTGASLIDLRFRIGKTGTHATVIDVLRQASMRSRYALLDRDPGVENVIGCAANVVLFEDGITVNGNIVRMSGYFDNENSAVRYLELLRWIAEANEELHR